MGKSTIEQKAYIDEVAKDARDLSSLVRKKGSTDGASLKRSASSTEQEETTKRAKTEDL
jgi:HAT1-interacting factor 1